MDADRNVDLAAATAEAMTGPWGVSLAGAAMDGPVLSAGALWSEARSWTRTFLPAPAMGTPGLPAITTAAFGFLEPGASAGGSVSDGSVSIGAMATDATTVSSPTGVQADLNADFADAVNPKLCHQ